MTRKILGVLMATVTVAVGLGAVASAYAGTINPPQLPITAVVAMTAPVMAPVLVVVFVLDLIWWRRSAIFAGICLAVIFPSILDNYPVHPGQHKLTPEDASHSWTLLTYNVAEFSMPNQNEPGTDNPTLSAILSADADVVCLQETTWFGQGYTKYCSQEQIDSLNNMYPHQMIGVTGIMLLSKFPVEAMDAVLRPDNERKSFMASYALDIYGTRVALFNVHMSSMYISEEGKDVFRRLVTLRNMPPMDSVKSELLHKIEAGAILRAEGAEAVARAVNKYGGENVVVCGDFNDVPGSYALRCIEDCGLKSVYASVGNLYMNTFHASGMYVRIDHVLWRGDMQPVSMVRGTATSSDHYPLLTTFVMTPSTKK